MFRDIDWFGLIVAMTAGLLAIVLLVSCVVAVGLTADAQKCMQYGYPRNATVGTQVYCIRSVDGSDQVTPLRDLQRMDK